ncbi:glyoxalase family protein [Listeria grandensis FSL F6-0971]|uniref:Glyoxalase family protein n=1 Tax=Listeria grandensis FSL F6-0971 TaxID=1265819 RepID=W7AXW9_9LIST|nr:hypothetical protein [Listeria grandensis]EUJ19889.1 glyoxalase family protein [Listeria grandensis FSL F6-0971]
MKAVGLKEYLPINDTNSFIDIDIEKPARLGEREMLVLELMEYHTPKTTPIDPETIRQKDVTTVEGVKHIALSVRNIETEFSRVKKIDGVTFINKSLGYEPCKIDDITINDFEISGENVVGTAKEEVQRNISNTWYFYFLDKYGVQWEFEQGHVDLIN